MKRCLFILFFLVIEVAFSQENDNASALEFSYFRGNTLLHSPDLAHLISGHPEGVVVSFSKKTNGKKVWHSLYNYPDYGGYFLFQDFKNEFLGKNYAIGVHYNFYFLKRAMVFKIAQGIALSTNPYSRETNSKNTAFGSKIMGNINFMLNYKKDNCLGNLGFQTGFIFTHFSNGRIKSPNSGINTLNFNLGLTYSIDNNQVKNTTATPTELDFSEPIKYNLVLRSGVNQSPIVGSGSYPFYHFSCYADKRLNKKSAVQLGTELFLSNFNKEFINYQSIAYPSKNIDPATDYKRVGVFVGHELFINKISLEAQLGYYIYQPYKYDIPVYDRIGMKYYINDKIFTGFSLKTHGFLAEAMEFVVGVRL